MRCQMQCEKLEDKIIYFKGAIENPEKLLLEIENTNSKDYLHHLIYPWGPWVSGDGDYTYGERRFVRGSEFTDYPENSAYIINTLVDAMYNTANKYAEMLGIEGTSNLGKNFVINKYATGESMGSHVDYNEKNTELEYSFVFYLNDDYEGGEIYWPNHGISLKPEAGSVVIFPSKEPYQHAVKEVTKGNKIFIPHFWYTN
jgi:predicted 2-oxoglutarate/Fe(II)-dependent dioxygenase YbiX